MNKVGTGMICRIIKRRRGTNIFVAWRHWWRVWKACGRNVFRS